MIGLEEIKNKINKIINTFKFYKKLGENGFLNIELENRNMCFTGNPGTCKTTSARILYHELLSNNVITGQFIQCGRSDLIGKYVGWTAPMIRSKFAEAEDGILFIDEAYSLLDDTTGGYGAEAISTIVDEMEKHRNDVIVIFAGYPQDMKDLIESNPGLRSRINFYIDFPDYTVDELVDILKYMADRITLQFTPKALKMCKEIISNDIGKENFGNGRYIRNLLDQIVMAHANRIMSHDDNIDDIVNITAKDVKDIDMKYINIHESKIGF